MEIEQTLVLIKPDAIERGLVGEIMARFEKVGLKLISLKMVWPNSQLASDHYGDVDVRHSPLIKKLMVDFLTSGPVIASVWDGVGAIEKVRLLTGSTYPHQAAPGTIRGDLAHVSKDYANSKEIGVKNLIHASSDQSEARREIKLWFSSDELINYELVHEKHTRK